MRKQYVVTLTEGERADLGRRLSAGRGPAREFARARILLKADAGPSGPAWPDADIAAVLDVSVSTVERVRERFAEGGLEASLRHRRPRREYRRKLDGEQEAHLVALACSPPPLGRRFWSLRLLADRMIELRFVDGLSYETVRRLLKKNELKPWLTERWCIPPEANGEFVWRMEDVLEVYTRPYDPKRPQVCMDEVSKQLVADTRPALAPSPGRPRRVDYEYERKGTANLFLCCEPLRGWRSVRVTDRRTGLDWAHCIRELVDVHYPDADKIVLVLDNLNTHTPRLALRGVPAGGGEAPGRQARDPPHPEARELAEHRRTGAECAQPPVPGPPHPGSGGAGAGGRRLASRPERAGWQGRLALHHGGRTGQAQAPLPVNRRVTGY